MKLFIILGFLGLSSLSHAKTIELNQKNIELSFGDISEFYDGETLKNITLIQTVKTPNTVNIKVKYRKPAQVCNKKKRYKARPICDERHSDFSGRCEPYFTTLCLNYVFDVYSDYRYNATEVLKIKFDKKSGVNKKLFITIVNEKMTPKFNLELGDFERMKMRKKSLLRLWPKIVLY